MPVHQRTLRYNRRGYPRAGIRLHVEALELRNLPSVTGWPGFLHPVAESEPNNTLDQAQDLGKLTTTPRAELVGTIGNAPAGAAGVDWYRFQLDRAANVTLTTPKAQANSPPVTTLSLYNSDPNDFNDLYDPLGYRLLEQSDSAAHGGTASINRRLAPGTYYVAVSGSGNDYFHPFIDGSGYAGKTGDYGLLVTAADLGLTSGDGPAVLGADPVPAAALNRSPFLIRVDLSAALDPATIQPGSTVGLFANANGTFGDGNDQPVALAGVNFSPAANELQLAPAAPLAPGFYQVFLAGNAGAGNPVLANPNGTPLGKSPNRPSGADFSYTFHVVGNEGLALAGTTADDTPATAHQLGDATNLGLVLVPGAIGDDSTDPIPFNPADVDLYHFHISGPGRFAFVAEVFAGRIGSPLDPGLTLFQVGTGGGPLQLIAVNDNTLNDTPATNGTVPLFTDPALFAGLTAGDYYLAVSGTGNLPDPALGLQPGTNGVFDPNVSHSGQGGYTTGPYLLNLYVQPVVVPPQVVTTTPLNGDVLSAPPTNLLVRFSEPINLQQLAYSTFQQTTQTELQAVYVRGSNGVEYHPRLLSYDGTTQQARFLMLDGLPNGTYELHLSGSGALGLADLAGEPLTGNDASGDYVVHFTVNGPQRGTNGNPLQWYDQEPNNSVTQPQDLGVLFPHELQAGVTVTRDPSLNPGTVVSDTADYYRFQVLQSREYILSLSGSGLPPGAQPNLFDAAGNPIPTIPQGSGGGVRVSLDPGTYVVGVSGWTRTQAPRVKYQLRMSIATTPENPTPLTIGPSPAYRIVLAYNSPPAPPAPTPVPPAQQTPPPPAPSTTPPAPAPAPPASTSTMSPTSAPTTTPAPTVSQPTTPPGTTPPAPTVSQPPPTPAPVTPPVSMPPAPAASTSPAPAAPSAPPAAPPAPAPSPPATPTSASSVGAPAAPAASSPSASPLPPVTPPPASAPPPGAPVSAPRLDIAVPSAAGNGAGILLIANYRLAGEVSSFAAIPSDVLVGLSAVPVGGVRGAIRSDAPPPADRLLARNAERQIELTISRQPSPENEPNQQRDPAAQAVPSSGDAAPQHRTEVATMIKRLAHALEGIWREALDNLFMNDSWQLHLSDWLERLPRSATPQTSLRQDITPDDAAADPENSEAGLPNSASEEPLASGLGHWVCAGMMFGMGTLRAVNTKKRHALAPAAGLRGENDEMVG